MSRFFTSKYSNLIPYTPGEQPKDRKFVKLNTNESPFATPECAVEAAKAAAENAQLYSDPECTYFRQALARRFDVDYDMTIAVNGSDEILNFAFMAFCDDNCPALFPDISYGFYPVFANLSHIPYKTFPLREDFTVDIEPYKNTWGTVVIANPTAPTGIALSLEEIEEIVASNPDRVVIVDEAYVDFGTQSAVPLVKKYSNLLVTQTFSKSRSMAGARLGFGIAQKELIADLNTLRYSTNPYNVNSLTLAMGKAVLENDEITAERCQVIADNREWTKGELARLGFTFTPSKANFIFARHPEISGGDIYTRLREKGVLVRHFTAERICEYNRITVGSREQMETLIKALEEILEEK
ncbi:MAG: histidinol-phosphate transaminase [Clostridia bacterium]|nr:histidinol-phosphate transaminase [Clostridia bacterium]